MLMCGSGFGGNRDVTGAGEIAVRGLEDGGLSEKEHTEKTGMWIWSWRVVSEIMNVIVLDVERCCSV